MGVATAFRTAVGWLELSTERAAPLVKLGLESQEGGGAGRAQAEFRDELIAVARGFTEVAVRELRRGVDDLDAFTRPDEPRTGAPHRPYKTKR